MNERNGVSRDIRAVFFDIGGTLLHPSPDVPVAFANVAAQLGFEVPLELVKRHMPAVDALYEREYRLDGDFWCSRAGCRDIWLKQYRLLSELVGLGDAAERISEALHEAYHRPDHWACFEDVESCLERLSERGCSCIAVSNWDADLPELLEGLGIRRYFVDVVASAAVGVRKPDPSIFELALDRNDLTPRDVVHIGDHIDADARGASNVGIRPILIDRFGLYRECPYECATTLSEAMALL